MMERRRYMFYAICVTGVMTLLLSGIRTGLSVQETVGQQLTSLRYSTALLQQQQQQKQLQLQPSDENRDSIPIESSDDGAANGVEEKVSQATAVQETEKNDSRETATEEAQKDTRPEEITSKKIKSQEPNNTNDHRIPRPTTTPLHNKNRTSNSKDNDAAEAAVKKEPNHQTRAAENQIPRPIAATTSTTTTTTTTSTSTTTITTTTSTQESEVRALIKATVARNRKRNINDKEEEQQPKGEQPKEHRKSIMHPHRQRIQKVIQDKYHHYTATPIVGLPRNKANANNENSSTAANKTHVAAAAARILDATQNRDRIRDFRLGTAPEPVVDEESNQNTESETPTKEDPLNIMLFYADDWTLKVLGALNPHVKTPHIDALARDGMLFPHNCVTTSICWISRGTLATGTYAAIHNHLKISDENLFTNPHFEWKDTLYPLLRQHGYYSGHVGKWHGPMPGIHAGYTFDVMDNYYGRHWEMRNGQQRHVTDLNGEDALNFLRRRPQNQPFHLTVAFFATHAMDYEDPPYNPMNETMDLYADVDIPEVRTNTEEHWKSLPWFFEERNEGRHRYTKRFDTPENYQRNIKDLYRMATEVDAVVGAVVEELQDQGVYNNTLIMFTTDNGNLHGEHGLAEKWYPFEESIRVPLVIRDPRMPEQERGKVNDEFTLSVDLAPTILQAAQIPVPDFMQGRDMSELYLQPEVAHKTWRKDFFYEWTQGEPINAVGHNVYYHIPAVFALIRKDYKYFYWPQVKYEQLFQIEKDPDEEFDIVNATGTTTQEVLLYMRARYEFLKNYSQSGHPV